MQEIDRRHVVSEFLFCTANAKGIIGNMIIVAVIGVGGDRGLCGSFCFFFGWYLFFCLFQEPADIADFLHSVYREAHIILESDVTHGNIAADFTDAFNEITAVVDGDFSADKV